MGEERQKDSGAFRGPSPGQTAALTPADQRKRFISQVYSQGWLSKVLEYGLGEYHRQMIALIMSLKPQMRDPLALDCATGTGFPFALELARSGFTIYGVDIAPRLVAECRKNAQEAGLAVKAVVGDAESLPYRSRAFSLCYCFQSTWYFPELPKAIAEMSRVTAEDGFIVFDVMNLLAPRILVSYYKFVMRRFVERTKRRIRGQSLDDCVVHETPTTPWRVGRILRRQRLAYRCGTAPVPGWDGRESRKSLFAPRLVYICRHRLDGVPS